MGIGKICNYIQRPLQNMFEVELINGETFLVPHVLQFVSEINNSERKISFQNISELKSL